MKNDMANARSNYKIMLVDDEPANLRLLDRLFRREYQTITAASGEEALRLLEQHDVALIISDQRMPGMTGLEFLKRASAFRQHTVRILLTGYTDVATLVEALNWGEVYKYVTKPWSNEDLKLTVSRALEHYETRRGRHELSRANERLQARLKGLTEGFVRAIVDALEAKDEYVHGHARRVSGYSIAIARRMGLGEEDIERLHLAALLHDIGKIGTPEKILAKPTLLDADEMAIMRLHAERGARMLAGIAEMQDVTDVIRFHHERFDGSGYPEGLRGVQIPLASRIIHVADAYDAMTSPRPFLPVFSHAEALRELVDGSGTQFDPDVVREFCGLQAISHIRRSIEQGETGGLLCATAYSLDHSPAEVDELRNRAETEPAIAAAVLRRANRRPRGGRAATSLQQAMEELGESVLREVFEDHCTSDLCPNGSERLWEHSLRCAEAARALADQTGLMASDEAYTLGLLHDVGEVLLRSLFPAEMTELQEIDESERERREVEVFGVDHAQVSQWILEACGLPRRLNAAVQTHHDALRLNDPIALLLHVADAIANADAPYKVAALDALGSDRLSLLGVTRVDLAVIHGRIESAMESKFAIPG